MWILKQFSIKELYILLRIVAFGGIIAASFWMGYVGRHYKTIPWHEGLLAWVGVALILIFVFKLLGIINGKECDEILRQQALEEQAAEKSTAEHLPGEK